MRVRRLHLRDIGPFSDAILDFPLSADPARGSIHILAGPNGCGKSTALYALALLLAGPSGGAVADPRLVTSRFRSTGHPFAGLETDEGEMVGARPRVPAQGTEQFAFGASTLPLREGTEYAFFVASTPHTIQKHLWPLVGRLDLSAPHTAEPLSTAAFAYSGARSVTPVQVQGTAPLPSRPLEGCLAFSQAANTQAFAQWIVNLTVQEDRAFRRRATANGDAEERQRAEERLRVAVETRQRLERAIGDVIGEEVHFEVVDEPWDVLLVRRGERLRLEVLPDGLKSILSWLGDLLMRLDRLPWVQGLPIPERRFILLLDEVDIHLHPAWQRTVLPMVQALFPQAQVFVTTHSPFVLASVAGAWIHSFNLEGSGAVPRPVVQSQAGTSIRAVLRRTMGVKATFDVATERKLADFYAVRGAALEGRTGAFEQLRSMATDLSSRSDEVRDIVVAEVEQVANRLGVDPW